MLLNFRRPKKYEFFESIEYLPIWNFRMVEEKKDFRYLIKSIDYDKLPKIEIDLNGLWNKIYNQYLEDVNPQMLADFKMEFITIEAKKREYLFIMGCLKILSIKRDDELIGKIAGLGYQFNTENDETYSNSIADLERQTKGLLKMIERKSADFKRKYQNDASSKVDIEDIMVKFTEHFGVMFDAKKLTVKQYNHYLKRYNKAEK